MSENSFVGRGDVGQGIAEKSTVQPCLKVQGLGAGIAEYEGLHTQHRAYQDQNTASLDELISQLFQAAHLFANQKQFHVLWWPPEQQTPGETLQHSQFFTVPNQLLVFPNKSRRYCKRLRPEISCMMRTRDHTKQEKGVLGSIPLIPHNIQQMKTRRK